MDISPFWHGSDVATTGRKDQTGWVIIEGASVNVDEVVEADLCIVGAGPAGLALAREFIGTDHRVYILETGNERIDDRARALADGDVVGHPYFDLAESRGFAVGGSSHLWDEWMRARRLDPIDFRTRPWVPGSGWPIGLAELAPFYDRAEPLLGLSPADLPVPETLETESLRAPLFRYSNTFDFEAMRREIEASANVCLIVNSTVIDLIPDPSNTHLERAVATSGPSHQYSISSRVFVLAGGGIEIPRLLLAARDGRGIANSSGLVGRYFMEHPTMRSGVVVPDHLDDFPAGHFEFRSHGSSYVKGALAPSDEAMEQFSMLNCMVLLAEVDNVMSSEGVRSMAVVKVALRGSNHSGESASGHLLNAITRPRELWRYAAKGMLYRPESRLRLSISVEQAPDRSSRVLLGERRDEFGVPVAMLDWRLGDLERHTVRCVQESVNDLFQRRGWGQIETKLGEERPPRSFRGEWHHLGTTRMSSSPNRGVVDETGRAHDLPNLYIAGGSTFPTVGYANPTLTIVALSLRLAHELQNVLSRRASLGPIW